MRTAEAIQKPLARGASSLREERLDALEEIQSLAAAVADRRSLRLWDIQVGGRPGQKVVRVFVDDDGGVDLDTVAEVSEEISRGLDLKDPIEGRYTLEVSSPGLERTLTTPEHFALSRGAKVVIKTADKLVGRSHRFEGTIAGAGERAVTLEVDGDLVEMPYEAIKYARTVFEWR
jgi:ribosome maturation factor RimP